MSLLQKLEQKRLNILEQIGKIRYMRRGTINEQYLKVPQKKKEALLRGPYYVLSRNEDGKTKSLRLNKSNLDQVRQDIEAHKEFHKLSKEYVDVTEALAQQERVAEDAEAVKKLLCHEEYNSEIEKFCQVVRKNLDRGNSVSLEDLEEGMREAALRDGSRMLSALLSQIPDRDQQVLCPVCQHQAYRDGTRTKQLVSLLGEGSVSRTYYSCHQPGCPGHRFPKDEFWTSPTPLFHRACAD